MTSVVVQLAGLEVDSATLDVDATHLQKGRCLCLVNLEKFIAGESAQGSSEGEHIQR